MAAGHAAEATVTRRRSGAPKPIEHDADGFMKFDGFVRVPCTGDGCDVIPYVPVETDPAVALCHECTVKRSKEAKTMAAKKKTKGDNGHGAKAASGGDYIERSRFQEALPCKISPDNLQPKANELANVIAQRTALKSKKRELNAQFREKINFFDEREEQLAESIREGIERRPVECVERFNTRTNTIEVVRLDTAEIVRERAATAEDRQEDLPGLDLDEPAQPQANA